MPRILLLFVSAVWLACTLPAQAATTQFNYAWTASNLFDSNANPPPNNLISTSGTFSVIFDPLSNTTLEDVPIVAASPFTDNEGVTLTSSDIFSTISVRTILPDRTYQIVVGGIVSPLDKADESVGDTNDFRLTLFVEGGSGASVGQPLVNPFFAPYSVSNGAFGSITGDLSVTLVSAAPIPLPGTLPLLLLGLAGLGWMRRGGSQVLKRKCSTSPSLTM